MDKQLLAQQLAAQYARIVDDREFERMAELMWPEFTQQGPGFGAESLQQFIDNLEILRNYSRTFHMVGSSSGEWEGDSYAGETYCIASHFYEQDGTERKLDMGIRYRDVIELRNGQAKYSSRDLNIVWTEDRVVEAAQL